VLLQLLELSIARSHVMKFTGILLGALASIASAHSDPREAHAGLPQIVGGRKFLSELKARNALPDSLVRKAHVEERKPALGHAIEERQNNDGQCGPGIGSCTSNCCSSAG
jgi:hypothetical protein